MAEAIHNDISHLFDTNGQIIDDKLYVDHDAAAVLGVSISALRAWRYDRSPNAPKHIRIGARAIRYRGADLKAYIEAQATASAA